MLERTVVCIATGMCVVFTYYLGYLRLSKCSGVSVHCSYYKGKKHINKHDIFFILVVQKIEPHCHMHARQMLYHSPILPAPKHEKTVTSLM